MASASKFFEKRARLTTPRGLQPDRQPQLTGTKNSSTGLWLLQSIDITSFSSSTGYAEYPIDANRVLLVSLGQNQLGLMTLEGITISKSLLSELTSPAPKGRALCLRSLFKRADKRNGPLAYLPHAE